MLRAAVETPTFSGLDETEDSLNAVKGESPANAARRAATRAIKRGLESALRSQLRTHADIATSADATSGRTLLHHAAFYDRPSFLRIILREVAEGERVAALNARGGPLSETALHVAARHGAVSAMAELIQAGAELDVPDTRGCTAMMVAVQQRCWAAACVMLSAGAAVDAVEPLGGASALVWLCEHWGAGEGDGSSADTDLALTYLLLRFGADAEPAISAAVEAVISGRARPLLLDTLSHEGGLSLARSDLATSANEAALKLASKAGFGIDSSTNIVAPPGWIPWAVDWYKELRWRWAAPLPKDARSRQLWERHEQQWRRRQRAIARITRAADYVGRLQAWGRWAAAAREPPPPPTTTMTTRAAPAGAPGHGPSAATRSTSRVAGVLCSWVLAPLLLGSLCALGLWGGLVLWLAVWLGARALALDRVTWWGFDYVYTSLPYHWFHAWVAYGSVVWWWWIVPTIGDKHAISTRGGVNVVLGLLPWPVYQCAQLGCILGIFVALVLAQVEPARPELESAGRAEYTFGHAGGDGGGDSQDGGVGPEERARRDGVLSMAVNGLPLTPKTLCPSCLAPRDEKRGVRHSRLLRRCVVGFDHDCPLLGTAVGHGNHGAFIAVLVMLLLNVALGVGPFVHALSLDPSVKQCTCHRVSFVFRCVGCYFVQVPHKMFTLVGGLLQACYGGSLLMTQLYLYSVGQTSAEFLEESKPSVQVATKSSDESDPQAKYGRKAGSTNNRVANFLANPNFIACAVWHVSSALRELYN
jgi:hypothetical protein